MKKKGFLQKVIDFFGWHTEKPEPHRLVQKEKKHKPIHHAPPSAAKEVPVAEPSPTKPKEPSLPEKKIEKEKLFAKTPERTPVAREKIEQLKEKFAESLDLLEEEEIKFLLSEEILRHWLTMGENPHEFDEKFNEAMAAITKDYGIEFFTPFIQEVHRLGNLHPSSYTAQDVLDTILDEMG